MPGAGARGDQAVVEVVGQEVDGLVEAVGEHAEPEGDRPAEAAAGDEAPERRASGPRGSGVHGQLADAASRRTSACTAASVPTKRAASTQSASAASAGESSSSAPGSELRLDQVARRPRSACRAAPRASSVTSARGSARSRRCSSVMMPKPPKPPTWSLVRS